MSPTDKQKYKVQVAALAAQLQGTKSMLAVPIPPTPPVPPMAPAMLQPSLAPLLGALRTQADLIEKLIKLVGDVVESS